MTPDPGIGQDRRSTADRRWPDAQRRLEAGIDFERANAARIYDYLLGGAHNFAVDREQATKILAQNPDMAYTCRANRSFLRRAVLWCLDEGITQFLDLGSGVPTVGNVHEVALDRRPDARVAYVDFEPVAVAHALEVVDGLDNVSITRADLRQPDQVLTAPGVTDVLDFERPVAVLSVAVLHFVPDADLAAVMARYREVLVPGSVQVISHGCVDHDDPEVAERMRATQEGYRGSASEVVLRTQMEIHALLGDRPLVEPGMVDVVAWPAPEPGAHATGAYAAVARI